MKKVLSIFLLTAVLVAMCFAVSCKDDKKPVNGGIKENPGTVTDEGTVTPADDDGGEKETEPRENACGDGLTWSYDGNGTLSVEGEGAMWDYSSENGAPWSDFSREITAVELSDGVTYIGAYAFYMHTELYEVDMPKGLLEIGDSAFEASRFVYDFELPQGLQRIGNNAFRMCDNIEVLVLPDGLSVIGDYAFGSCRDLSIIDIPASVTEIGEGAFRADSFVREIYYGGSAEQWEKIGIGDAAFNINEDTMFFYDTVRYN